MFFTKIQTVITTLVMGSFLIQVTSADYTSEETNEKSKSLYSAVTSILGSTDSNKHHHRHTYDSPPCASGGCSSANSVDAFSPCSNPTGCKLTKVPLYNSGIGYSISPGAPSIPVSGSLPTTYTNGDYRSDHAAVPATTSVQGNWLHAPQQPQTATYGSVPTGAYGPPGTVYIPSPPASHQVPQGGYASVGYSQPETSGAYAHWNSHPNHYGYQGPRGYSVFDHSLKTNSEYKEVGSHSGPLQQSNNGNGYGSGYGGYNGLFNRPGF